METYPPASHSGIHNALAWEIVDPQRTQLATEPLLRRALDLARQADQLSDAADSQIAVTLARVLHLLGNSSLAFQAQQRAIRLALAISDADPSSIAQLTSRLREYAEALGIEVLDETQP